MKQLIAHLSPIAILFLAAAPLVAGCAMEGVETGEDSESIADTNLTFEEFEAQVYQEPDTGVYIVDGDIALPTIEHLRDYHESAQKDNALTILTKDGNIVKWSHLSAITLTYCVSPLFGDRYDDVVAAMASAAAGWEAAANVNFIHVPAQDTVMCNGFNTNVVFDVSPTNTTEYLARAFFPGYARLNRNILIDGDAFSAWPWSLTGILRHELGHALGFRHEHVRLGYAAPQSCWESWDWSSVTSYDSASVMHYPQCNGTQTGDLVLTAKDKAGAAQIYGASLGL